MSPGKDKDKAKCHCGQPLHYSDDQIRRRVEEMIKLAGGDEYIIVSCGGRRWRVQRHYIALHGLKAVDLPTLGFEELPPENGRWAGDKPGDKL